MEPQKLLSLLDGVMCDKVWNDLDQEKGPLDQRVPGAFHTFMFDAMIMSYGLQTIAIKVLMQMSNGINAVKANARWAFLLNRMLGLGPPLMRKDEI